MPAKAGDRHAPHSRAWPAPTHERLPTGKFTRGYFLRVALDAVPKRRRPGVGRRSLRAVRGATRNALWALFGFEAARMAQGARDYVWRQADHVSLLRELMEWSVEVENLRDQPTPGGSNRFDSGLLPA